MIRTTAALLTCAVLAVPAPAARSLDTVHRGSAGCFTWSWKDGGVLTTTVYFRNHCRTAHTIRVHWSSPASGTEDIRVAGGAKGSTWSFVSTRPTGFEDLGRA
ncbi:MULTISPECIES: hypothetical protein [Streptomyces]|uniref:hypothetical protein n=1 Tax=Streptomyces TaxID=1883 RepID=UPI00210CFE68|nr:hypothetical protein [Streptomyces longispororuber]MCQ4212194.1 hypothetical protein [Streptomyces longispororuber]